MRGRPAEAPADEAPGGASGGDARAGDREVLEARWLDLTRRALPRAARGREDWPVRLDHCFQRILLDHAVGGVWCEAVPRRPAYRHAPRDVLERAIAAGEAVLEGRADLAALNRASLGWRRMARGG